MGEIWWSKKYIPALFLGNSNNPHLLSGVEMRDSTRYQEWSLVGSEFAHGC